MIGNKGTAMFYYDDVKEAVLEFENYLKYLMKITNNPTIYKGLLIKHKEIFGDFEK